MATGTIVTNNGLKLALNRIFKSVPNYLAPSKFKIGVGTSTPTVIDTDVESGVNINGGATKSFVTGYPSINEASLQSTIRCLLNTMEGNGNAITEFGIFNQDGTPLMYSHSVFVAITKTSSVQVSFVQRDKVE